MTGSRAMNCLRLTLAAVIGAFAVACSSPNPNAPSVTFMAPAAQTANNSVYLFSDQPLSLKISNAAKTGSATTTYTVEVATDTAFANKVFTQSNIAEDPSGTTTFSVAVLPGAATYYWHSRAVVNNAAGQFSATQTFSIKPQITIQAPATIAPANGAGGVSATPIFTTNDAVTSGPVGQLFYTFQIASDPSFGASFILATGTIQEQPGQTSFTPSAALPGGTFYWRVQAQDVTNQIAGPFSAANTFTVVPFDMTQATIMDNPPGLGSWAQASTITSVVYGGGAVVVDFDKRTGPDRWPDVIPPGFSGPLEYTLGICENISNHWYCSAAIQYWFGRDPGASSNIAQDWFYDPMRWGPMAGYQPSEGETVGWFAAEGNLRNDTAGDASPLMQRTNVQLLPFTNNFASYTFSAARRTLSVKIHR